MPGIVAHHVFGLDAYRDLTPIIGESETERQAFLLGNLGPDPLFYLEATPAPQEVRSIARTMHNAKTNDLLRAMHDHFIVVEGRRGSQDEPAPNSSNSDSKDNENGEQQGVPSSSLNDKVSQDGHPVSYDELVAARKAYALGFLCHYLLDSMVHPLVYAQQHAICKQLVSGLSETWANRVVHATIETTIDEHLLTIRFGSTAQKTPPHKFALECPARPLLEISRAYRGAIMQAYGVNLVENAFVTAVAFNRVGQMSLDSRSAGLRRHFDYLSHVGKLSPYLRALSFDARSLPATAFTNNDHVPWKHPFSEGEVVSSSFSDLYNQALFSAFEVLPVYAMEHFGQTFCDELTRGINFLGKPY